MRTCPALLLVALLLSIDQRGRATTVAAAADHPDLPRNILVHEWLSEIVEDMLRGSDTFRAQCRWLGDIKRLHVTVRLEPDADPQVRATCNARCVMRRYQFGRIIAHVSLLTPDDAPRLVAHEFEHIREYVEGMNYLATSVQQPRQVWATWQGHYETARAIKMGNDVALEMTRYRALQATIARRAP